MEEVKFKSKIKDGGREEELVPSTSWWRKGFFKGAEFSVTRKKSPNVYKSFPKLISLENDRFVTPLQKLPKNVGDLGKLIAAKGFKKLPKVQ